MIRNLSLIVGSTAIAMLVYILIDGGKDIGHTIFTICLIAVIAVSGILFFLKTENLYHIQPGMKYSVLAITDREKNNRYVVERQCTNRRIEVYTDEYITFAAGSRPIIGQMYVALLGENKKITLHLVKKIVED